MHGPFDVWCDSDWVFYDGMPNAANHRRQKAERSGAFWRPSEFALLDNFQCSAFNIALKVDRIELKSIRVFRIFVYHHEFAMKFF